MNGTDSNSPTLPKAEMAGAAVGDDAGITLMELLPPVGWADVATKQDLELLESRLDAHFDSIETRFEQLEARLDLKFDARFERGFRQVLVTVSTLMVTGFATTIAVVLAR